ncbi:MAG TPA: hypothetical protein PK402_08155, partial [Tepidisphaeraceae bacterium]|nr:hypothetical protein [Tepidisphaeraceae bacterium]
KYEKVCPIHGKLNAEDIESGYEFAKDQYATIAADDLKNLRRGNDKTIGIEAFIPKTCVAPRYYSGRTMYLLPDGPVGARPYLILHQLLTEQKKFAFCTAVNNGKEQIMLMRPAEKVLAIEYLKFAAEVKDPSDLGPQLPHVAIPKKEIDLARMLFEQLSNEDFEISEWTNHYADDLRKMVEAKVKGRDVVVPPDEAEEPQVGDLMAALQRSLNQAKAASVSRRPTRIKKAKPVKRTARRPARRA